jgi:serine/threonine protein kinase
VDPERWKQVDELFDAVIELPADERGKFLNEKCDGDEELRREVLSLLEAHEKAEGFMESPALDIAAKNMAQEISSVENQSLVGREIGAYKIEKLLGVGGMGEVYLAHDAKLNRKVALKILPSQFVKDAERIKRFEREARAVSSLNHPNLITIYDIGNSEGTSFIATEFVEGQTVRDLISKKLSMKDALSIAMQVAEALGAAHNEKIIHRDIKPENIMVRPDGYVKVLDFGLAKLIEPTSESMQNSFSHTHPGVVMGTLAYMSPEQATGEKVDQRTDIWSLGVVLYEMVTGVAPFKGANRKETLNEILSKEPAPASDSNPSSHLELDRILSKALEKDCEVRYQTASDFRSDLKRLMRAIDSNATIEINRHITRATKKKRALPKWFGWQFLMLGLITVLLSVFVAWWFITSRKAANTKETNTALGKLTFTKLTSQAGEEIYPSLSPDGKAFVYASRTSGNMDIYLQRVGGQNAINLTKDSTADETHPAFSNNGERIAFAVTESKGGIFIMGATGESKRRLTDFGYNPSWSPDDKEIVFATDRIDSLNSRFVIPSQLWIVNVVTGEKRKLPVDDGVQPNWSPKGERIAYWSLHKGGQRDVWTISVKDGKLAPVTNDAATDGNPVWSSDGKFLYFASDINGNMNFWRVAIDEKTGKTLNQPEAVTVPSSYSKHLCIARDGKHFAYVQSSSYLNLHTIEFDAKDEKTLGQPVAITQGANLVSNFDLSPDGEWFAYGFQTEKQEDIYVMRKDGTEKRQLTDDTAKDRSPRWSPDGKQIAFFSDRSGHYEAWVINSDGSNLRQVTFTTGTNVVYSFWSPDGTRFLYNRWESEPFIIDMSKRWEEQTPQQLSKFQESNGNFWARSWSSDGKKLGGWHLNNSPAGIVVYDFEKQTYERITDYGEDPVWLNDNNRLLFRHQRKIMLVDSRTKKVKEVFSLLPQQISLFGLSKDNRKIYFSLITAEAEIWMFVVE